MAGMWYEYKSWLYSRRTKRTRDIFVLSQHPTQPPTTMRASFKQLALLFLGLASQGIAMASPPTDSINADPKSLFAVNINNEVLGVSVKSLFQTTHTRT